MAKNEDLISRRALHSAGYEVYRKYCHDRVARHAMNELEKLIKDASAVDAAPVVHGRWGNWHYDPFEDCYVRVCSKCSGTNERMKPYCPNCGAKMDGGSTE